jgi:hypothetical protein
MLEARKMDKSVYAGAPAIEATSLHLRDVIKWVKPVNYLILTLSQSELDFI